MLREPTLLTLQPHHLRDRERNQKRSLIFAEICSVQLKVIVALKSPLFLQWQVKTGSVCLPCMRQCSREEAASPRQEREVLLTLNCCISREGGEGGVPHRTTCSFSQGPLNLNEVEGVLRSQVQSPTDTWR